MAGTPTNDTEIRRYVEPALTAIEDVVQRGPLNEASADPAAGVVPVDDEGSDLSSRESGLELHLQVEL